MKYHRAHGKISLVRRPSTLPIFILGMVIGVSISLAAYGYFYTTSEPLKSPFAAHVVHHVHHVHKLQNKPHEEDHDDRDRWPYAPLEIDEKTKHDHAVRYTRGPEGKVRILCWVMTSPASHETKAQHVKKTWGKRCDVLLFMSSIDDPKLPTVALEVDKEDRDHLWQKTKLAFEYVYQHYLEEADWFVKADDDTYMVVENLRFMLAPYNISRPIYFGHRLKTTVKQGFMSGGAGYVLSKEALVRFAVRDPELCRADAGGGEDVEIGKCLQKLGVEAGDSRDEKGAERFLPLQPEFFLAPEGEKDPNFWFWPMTYYTQNEGEKSISDSFVSFHYVSPAAMHVLDFMLYHARPYGLLAWYQRKDPKDHKMLLPHATGAA